MKKMGVDPCQKKEMLFMIITTTPSVEGRSIREYKGIVFGEVISGVDIFQDIGAGLRNIFGGRSSGYEEELKNARIQALGGGISGIVVYLLLRRSGALDLLNDFS